MPVNPRRQRWHSLTWAFLLLNVLVLLLMGIELLRLTTYCHQLGEQLTQGCVEPYHRFAYAIALLLLAPIELAIGLPWLFIVVLPWVRRHGRASRGP